MNGRQAKDSYKSGARIRPRHDPLVPSQYKGSEPWVRGKRGYGLAVGRKGKSILRFPHKLFQRRCPAGMTYHPKRER